MAPIVAATSPPALAQAAEPEASARKARLDALFTSLQTATDDIEAGAIVSEIWATWSRSGRTDVDRLMDEAGAGMETRNFGVASMLLDEVVSLAPDFAEGWNRRATLRFLMGDLSGSDDDIAKVLALEPRHFGALSGRAMVHMKAGRWQQALDAYRAALRANPFLPERHQVIPVLERKAAEGRL
jgi:tetratricopeptide (TPR) repeat protein